MKIEEALDFVAEKIADQIEEMFPDSKSIREEEVDKVIYDSSILNDLQERAIDILSDRGFIDESLLEEDEEEEE